MRKTAAILMLGAVLAAGAETPRWLRGTTISPDGTTIAFTYKGDIYTVPASGGHARRITVSEGYDANPHFSPDGSRIAFNSSRHGNADVFVVDAAGGTPVRLTTHTAAERVRGWLNDSTVIFSADIMPAPADLNGPFFAQTYTVSTTPGSRPQMLQSLMMTAVDVNRAGDILFQNKKSYENDFRKHERSAGTPDIYLLRGGEFTRLSAGEHSSRTPVWLGQDGTRYAFTADPDGGTLNIYSATVGDSTLTQLTAYADHPVRSLSASADGSVLAYSYDGDIYTLRPGAEPVKLDVDIATDNYDADYVRRFVSSGAASMAVAPSSEEVAFTLRGDIYVTSVKYETTKRITNTPGQERHIDFAPDGRSMVYDSERDSLWSLYITKIKNDNEKNFTYSTDLEETLLYSSDKTAQQPLFSPDGKKVAFLEDRTILRVIDVESKAVNTALDGRFNYSYQDGDISFRWSPDSKRLLVNYIGIGGWNNIDIAMVAADGSETVDLTESGYADSDAKWALDGKAITYCSGRYGMKSHGSWGNEDDIMLMVLDGEAWDKFHMTKEEAELAEAAENESDGDDDEAEQPKKKKKKKNEEEETPATVLDLANRRYRTERLTERSARMGDYFLSPKGDKLYYLAAAPEGGYKLYERDIREDNTKVLASGIRGGFEANKDGDKLFILSGSGMKVLELASGDIEDIEFDAPYDRHPSLERQYIFDHAVRQVKDKFYDADIHGVDWDGYAAYYRQFLPYISNDTDFAELLSELLGELNASHTGASAFSYGSRMETASLGAYFDPDYEGDGLKVLSAVPRGPLATRKADVQPGDIILAIDDVPVLAGKNYFNLLDGKADRPTRLRIRKTDGSETTVTVKPTDSHDDLLYQAWVEHNEALVDSLSGGRIGYVHIEGMDSPSFRAVYDRLLGKYRNCDAVIVDTRFNGGGWLHNDVAQLLSGREYVRFAPRGQYIGSEPFSQWTKPSVMLVNEANYSDAYGTPYTYQALGIGDLVGAPVPGTMTAVWWEEQINPMLVFGIPQVTCLDMNGQPLENHQLVPEVTVYNTPAETTAGNDRQIAAAVARLLEKTASAPANPQ